MPLLALIVLLQSDVSTHSEPGPRLGRVVATFAVTLAGTTFATFAGGSTWFATTRGGVGCGTSCTAPIAVSSAVFGLAQLGLTPELAWETHQAMGGKGSFPAAFLGSAIGTSMATTLFSTIAFTKGFATLGEVMLVHAVLYLLAAIAPVMALEISSATAG
jgi:hypothetical protein